MPAPSPDALRFRTTRPGRPASPHAIAAAAVAGGIAGLAAATQYAADRLGYHPHLGPALYAPDEVPRALALAAAALCAVGGLMALRHPPLRRGLPLLALLFALCLAAARGPLYPPVRVVQWAVAYRRATAKDPAAWVRLRPVFERAAPVGAAAFLAAFGAGAALVAGAGRRRASNAHGTAEFGTGAELVLSRAEERQRRAARRAGRRMVEPGVMIGRLRARRPFLGGRPRPGRLLWYHGPSHVLTMAPTRSGKGVGAVIPALLRYPGSVVCLDIKGENFHVTHEERVLAGGTVHVLDPMRVTGEHGHHAYANPFDTIDTYGPGADRALDDCKALAEMLVAEEPKSPHFSDEGRSLLACVMLHVCHEYAAEPEERTLMKVRELLTLPEAGFAAALETMGASDHPLVRRGVARLLQKEERERTGVISTAQRGIDFLDSPAMARALGPGPGADPRAPAGRVDLTTLMGEAPVTVYLVLPPEALRTHAPWVRMMLACINSVATRARRRPEHRLLMLLDEFAQLGAVRPVVEGISLIGGYGVMFWIVIQDLAQLRGIYRENWETIFANCDVKQCFGTNDWTTAELLSKMTGEATIYTEGGSTGSGRSFGKSGGRSTNDGESFSEKGRRLLLPDEVLRLPPSTQLLFVKGSAPMLAEKVNYLEDEEFRGEGGQGRFRTNPLHE